MARNAVWTAVLAGMLALPTAAFAQTRQVTGMVTRASGGQPLAEATITQVGGRATARTSAEGRFTITLPNADTRILVRAIGYQRKEVLVPAGESSVVVSLTEDIFKLDEVIVTGQTTTLERRSATTAVATVAAEEITNAPSQSVEQALQGKVLGATINMNSGAPGGGGQIQIRGVTSILGNGQPLYVVDGVIVSNDAFSSGANAVTGAGGGGIATNQDQVVNRLADLNPSEIESIEVLKSAAATAIYGSRATNGVVVIRTKRGQPGQARFNITQRVGVANPLNLIGSRRFNTVDEIINDTPAGYFAGYDGTEGFWSTVADGSGNITAEARARDLQEDFYGNRKPQYETIANISGGTQSLQYFVSATNRQEQGLARFTGARLQSLRANIDQTWSSKFKTSAGVNITRNVLNRGLGNNDNTFTSPIYNFGYTPSVFPLGTKDENGNYPENPLNGGGNGASNPFQTFEFLTLTEDVFRYQGNATQSFTPIATDKSTVSFVVAGGFDGYNQNGTVISPAFLQYEGNDGFFGRVARSNVAVLNYNAQGTINWTYTPKAGTSFTTTAGFSYERQGFETNRLRGRGTLPGVDLAAQGTIDGVSQINEFRDQALFVNEQIVALDGKLAITGGFRADRSSANGDVGKYYVFPRGAVSYNFTPGGIFSSVKPRFSIGQTGNRPRFGDRDVLLAGGSNIGGQISLVNAGLLGNANIRPETLTEYEAGADITAFNDKVQFEGTYYNRRISNQLLQPAVAPSTGITNLVVNAGRLKNEGIELGVTVAPVTNPNGLSWVSRTTWQKNTQRILELPDEIPPFPVPGSFGAAFGRNRIKAGELTTAIWGYARANNTDSSYAEVGANLLRPGQTFRRDTIIGDANPDFQMFFNNNISFKRLSLSFTFDWRKGGDVANMTQLLFDEGGNSRDYTDALTTGEFENYAALRDGLGRGLTAAEISSLPADLQRAGAFRYAIFNTDTRQIVQDGSFVRLRDVSLSLEAPQRWAQAIGGRTLRFNLQGRNLLLFSDYWGFDPEFNNFGNTNLNRFIDLAPYPPARSFNFSIDVGF